MKKFVLFLCTLLVVPLLLCGCKKTNPLTKHVVELKSNVYIGKSENVVVSASYGFTINADNVKQYALTFKLKPNSDTLTDYTLKMLHDGKTYTKRFSQNPISHALTTAVEVENFSLEQFEIELLFSGEIIKICLTSTLPKNTLSHTDVLTALQKNQNSLISHYTDQNGNFTAKIRMRIIVKEQKPYWYIGFIDSEQNLKAFLVDGFSGEVLAIREVF
jgi:hypothetical protein